MGKRRRASPLLHEQSEWDAPRRETPPTQPIRGPREALLPAGSCLRLFTSFMSPPGGQSAGAPGLLVPSAGRASVRARDPPARARGRGRGRHLVPRRKGRKSKHRTEARTRGSSYPSPGGRVSVGNYVEQLTSGSRGGDQPRFSWRPEPGFTAEESEATR